MSSTRSRYVLSEASQAAFLAWWHGLISETASGTARTDRAILKRAGTLIEVACAPAYQRIYRKMATAHGGIPWQANEQERIAALIGLAAHVRAHIPLSLPQAMSHCAEGSDRKPVSDLRFARLLDSPDIESLFVGLRRTLPLIDHCVNPRALAEDVFGWGDVVKRRWAYAYRWSEATG